MLKYILILVVVIGAILTGVYVLQSIEKPDPATAASSDANLKRVGLPEDLPALPIETPTEPAADDVYPRMLQRAQSADRVVNAGLPESEKMPEATAVCRALISTVGAGRLADGFADAEIAASEMETQRQATAMRALRTALRVYVTESQRAGEYEQAEQAALAGFEFGRRHFTQNVRLRPRMNGLGLMKINLGYLHNLAKVRHEAGELDADQFEAEQGRCKTWLEAIAAIEAKWQPKIKAIGSVEPIVGDLLRVAALDEDPTFRIFATLQLGYAKLVRGDPGNHPAIILAIEEAKSSDVPEVQAAAAAAETMTIEQYRQIIR